MGVVEQLVQHGCQIDFTPVLTGVGIAVEFQHIEDGVYRPGILAVLDQSGAQRIRRQLGDCIVNHFNHLIVCYQA